MEVVSHLLFEACRKIIAQLQAAAAESLGEGDCKEEEKGGIWECEIQMDYMCMSGKWAMRQEGRT